jgi:hypothetical protein
MASQAKQGAAKKPLRHRQGSQADWARRARFDPKKGLLRAISGTDAGAGCSDPKAKYSHQDRSQAVPSHCVLEVVIGQGDHEFPGLR